MAKITAITEQKRRPNRRNVFIDGEFAFGCHLNVVARFRLRDGMQIEPELRRRIEEGQVQQEALDYALRLIGGRMQSERQLRTKLTRREFGAGVVEAVIQNLKRLGYADDEQFARTRATELAKVKRVGRQRAIQELCRAGIDRAIAERTAGEVYGELDTRQMALELATRKAPSLARLESAVARRRLVGFLQRRGFDLDTIRHVVEKALGAKVEP